jgi:hypothetical protein
MQNNARLTIPQALPRLFPFVEFFSLGTMAKQCAGSNSSLRDYAAELHDGSYEITIESKE